jgi:hypothetical protein
MKKTILTAIIFAMSLTAFAQHDYTHDENHVYYHGMVLRLADIETFQDLGYGYAKDAHHVYQNGNILEYVDPHNFRIDSQYRINNNNDLIYNRDDENEDYNDRYEASRYHKTNFDVYYNGRKLDGATASSFKDLGRGYAKDAFNVYYFGRKLEDATASSFLIMDGGYAKDSFNAYYHGKKLPDVSGTSNFKYQGNGYATDGFNMYYDGRKIDNQ